MATIGRGILSEPVFNLFEGLRTFDAERAVQDCADDVLFDTPWTGRVTGKKQAKDALAAVLSDPQRRQSLTIVDVAGDGARVDLLLSASGLFGRAPRHVRLRVLCLKGVIHQVVAG